VTSFYPFPLVSFFLSLVGNHTVKVSLIFPFLSTYFCALFIFLKLLLNIELPFLLMRLNYSLYVYKWLAVPFWMYMHRCNHEYKERNHQYLLFKFMPTFQLLNNIIKMKLNIISCPAQNLSLYLSTLPEHENL
jgi:hypothetical protein